MWLILLLYALFASVFTIGKIALVHASPALLVGIRMSLAGLCLIGFVAIFRSGQFKLSSYTWWRVFLLGLINIYLVNILEFEALRNLSSFKTCFFYSLSPFLSALFAYFLLNERLSSKKWLGLIVGMSGVLPLMVIQSSREDIQDFFQLPSINELLIFLAVCASVYGWILMRQVIQKDGFSPIMANGVSMAFGGLLALTHFGLFEGFALPAAVDLPVVIVCTLLLLVISNFICYNLYGYLLQHYSVTFLSFAGFSTPFFTALFGWLLLGEKVTWEFYLAAGLVFCGLILFYREEMQPKPVAVAAPV